MLTSKVDEILKAEKIKLSASEKNQFYNVVSWYDESAAKVIKKKEKLKGDKLDRLLNHLGCSVEQLPDFGYYPTDKSDEFIFFDSQYDMRDSELIPLEEPINDE